MAAREASKVCEPPAPAPAPEGPTTTKCVSCKYGTGDKVAVAMTEADFTPAWVSAVLDAEVKSFNTKLCGQGQCSRGCVGLVFSEAMVLVRSLRPAYCHLSRPGRGHDPYPRHCLHRAAGAIDADEHRGQDARPW